MPGKKRDCPSHSVGSARVRMPGRKKQDNSLAVHDVDQNTWQGGGSVTHILWIMG